MAQIFHRSTNTLSRVSIYGFVFFIAAVGGLSYKVNQSAYFTEVNVARDQPVPFSHKHHAGELGIDCRYCHTSVEQSSFAGIPATHVCMSCHSQIWVKSPMLEPVRASYARLLRPPHPREQGHRLHDLPRPDRRDADHLAGQHALHAVVHRLSQASRAIRQAARRRFQTALYAASGPA